MKTIGLICEGVSEINVMETILLRYLGETEYWLLPLFFTNHERCRTHNCIYTLNRELARKNLPVIPSGDEKNSPNALKAYKKILKNIRNKKTVEDISAFNYGFRQLVSALTSL